MGSKKKRDVWMEILGALVERLVRLDIAGVGWKEGYKILLRKIKSQGQESGSVAYY